MNKGGGNRRGKEGEEGEKKEVVVVGARKGPFLQCEQPEQSESIFDQFAIPKSVTIPTPNRWTEKSNKIGQIAPNPKSDIPKSIFAILGFRLNFCNPSNPINVFPIFPSPYSVSVCSRIWGQQKNSQNFARIARIQFIIQKSSSDCSDCNF